MARTALWYDVPVPLNNEVSPPVANYNFTVTNIDSSHAGELLQLAVNASGIYLNIQFRYGLNVNSKELGYIMKID